MKYTYFLTIVVLNLCCSCNQNPSLQGKWEEYKVEWVDTSIHSDPQSFPLQLEFKKGSKMIVYIDGKDWQYNYVLKKDTIFVENQPNYIIEKNTKDSLVLRNYWKYEQSVARRHYLKPVTDFKE